MARKAELRWLVRPRRRPAAAPAELVREAVEEYVARHARVRLPRSLGAGKSGRRDLGTRAESLLKGMGENR